MTIKDDTFILPQPPSIQTINNMKKNKRVREVYKFFLLSVPLMCIGFFALFKNRSKKRQSYIDRKVPYVYVL